MERTLSEEIEACAGEKVLSACLRQIGSVSDPNFSYTNANGVTIRPMAALDWGDVRDRLNYHVELCEPCDEVTAWSENWVLFIVAYDGNYWVGKVPRNPTDHSPHHFGRD